MHASHLQDPSSSILRQLVNLSVENRNAIVAACDRDRRYTHLFNPHPSFRAETLIGKRDEDLAPADRVAELIRLKSDVLETGQAHRRTIRINVEGEDRFYDVLAEPILDGEESVSGVATAAIDVTPSRELQVFLSSLSARLQREGDEIANAWHAELQRRMRIRPEYVFPGDDLLDGVPGILQWIAREIHAPVEMGVRDTDNIRGIAERWRSAGYSVEETLVHVRLLGNLLFDAMEEGAVELGHALAPHDGMKAARRLARAIEFVEVLIVAAYRDREDSRYGDFVGTLAHEVRDHLHTALSNLQLIDILDGDEGRGPQKKRQALDRAERALRRANNVVTAVRSLSRAAGAGSLEWESKPLRKIVSEVLDEHREKLPRRVLLEVEDVPSVSVPAAPVHMILHNLVENGVKYADRDADPAWVRIRCERSSRNGPLTVEIADNGVGIPEEDRERIFLRFQRGQTHGGDGFGLGLAIAKESAEQIGARVLLESEPGKGSTFRVVIPARHLQQ